MDWLNLGVGFVSGIVASLLAALAWDAMTRPKLSVVVDSNPARGPGYRWYNVKFSNDGGKPYGPDPRPAWGCKAALAILSADGNHVLIGPIPARWTSTPEPLTRIAIGDQLVSFVEPEKIEAGKRIDIYSHEEQLMPILLKHDNDENCYLFVNESYYHGGANPDWRLGRGKHRLRLTVHYERGRDVFDFSVNNYGRGMDEVIVEPLSLESRSI